MKQFSIAFCLLALLVASCEREERLLVGKTYSFTAQGCTPALELSCTKWIKFEDKDRVNYLPYGDIVFGGQFEIKGSTLTIYRDSDNTMIFKFTLRNQRDELGEIPSGEVRVLE